MKIKIIENATTEGAVTLTLGVVFSSIGACGCHGTLTWEVCCHQQREVKVRSFHALKDALGEEVANEVRSSIELWLDPP